MRAIKLMTGMSTDNADRLTQSYALYHAYAACRRTMGMPFEDHRKEVEQKINALNELLHSPQLEGKANKKEVR